MIVAETVLCFLLLALCLTLRVTLLRARHTIQALELQVIDGRAKRQQEEVRLARRAEIDAIKDELIGNVSHELRTPLTSIRGALGLLSAGLNGSLDARGHHLLRIATNNTDRLIRLVNDILDLERMEAGRAGLQLRRCSLTLLVQQAIEAMFAATEAAGIIVRFTAVESLERPPLTASASLPGLPGLTREAACAETMDGKPLLAGDEAESEVAGWISGPEHDEAVRGDRRRHDGLDASGVEMAFLDADADRILQVLHNLLSNALKFSPPESTVAIYLVASPDTLHLRVVDEGRGIPEDKLEVIFDRFQQVEITDARQKGGTGLGLAICRTIVQQHGGAIWAEQNRGAGASLCVDLPRIQRFSDQAEAAAGVSGTVSACETRDGKRTATRR